MKPTPLQQVYLDAAEAVASGLIRFSCTAVDSCASPFEGLFSPPRQLYERTMGEVSHSEYFDNEPYIAIDQFEAEEDENGWLSTANMDEARDLRVLALCFMAAACEDLE